MKRFTLILTVLAALLNCASAQEQPEFKFTCEPYLQNVTDTEATIVWGTSLDAISWVEIAPHDGRSFYAEEHPRFVDSYLGKRRIGKLHKVRITGLKPGTTYDYRIFSKEILVRSAYRNTYGRILSGDVYKQEAPSFTTNNTGQTDMHFAIFNDIHEESERYAQLYSYVSKSPLDFVVLNGDMVNFMDSREQLFDGFLNTSSKLFAKSTPFYMVRGNHETRGSASEEFTNMFHTSTGQTFYSFVKGGVFYLVLDGGEDKPDSDIEYGETADFDNFRTQETNWIKATIATEEFKQAKARVVLMHIPPCANTWHGTLEIQEKFIPILNQANINLMICGHTHRHSYHKPGETPCNFPILVNSNLHVLDVHTTPTEITIDIIDGNGAKFKHLDFKL